MRSEQGPGQKNQAISKPENMEIRVSRIRVKNKQFSKICAGPGMVSDDRIRVYTIRLKTLHAKG
jgi:hypothetical protein